MGEEREIGGGLYPEEELGLYAHIQCIGILSLTGFLLVKKHGKNSLLLEKSFRVKKPRCIPPSKNYLHIVSN